MNSVCQSFISHATIAVRYMSISHCVANALNSTDRNTNLARVVLDIDSSSLTVSLQNACTVGYRTECLATMAQARFREQFVLLFVFHAVREVDVPND